MRLGHTGGEPESGGDEASCQHSCRLPGHDSVPPPCRTILLAQLDGGNAPRRRGQTRASATPSPIRDFFALAIDLFLKIQANCNRYASAQIRTCLWLRADRWDPGQEARVTPRDRGGPRKVGSRTRTGEPRFSGGRDLKQRRSGLFWSLPAVQRPGLLKRHYLIAGRADRFSVPNEASEGLC